MRILEEIKLSKVSYLVEKLEKRNIKEKIKAYNKLSKYKISKKIGLYLIENSARDFEVNDEFGGISSSLIELCFKDYYLEYNDAIEKVFKDLSNESQDRVLYLLTTRSEKETLNLYADLVLKYYEKRDNIPIGELQNKPLSYPYVFPKLYKTLKFNIEKNNILILLNSYLNSGVVLKDDIKKNKKLITDNICNLFENALKYKFKNTYDGLHKPEYKDLRYFLELAVNIEYYVAGRKTSTYLEKLLKKNDNQLKLFILDNYIRKGKNLSKFKFDDIVKDKASRYALFELLNVYDKTDLMPKKYANQKSLSESDFYTNFVITTAYTNEPTKLKFYKLVEKDDYNYYVYKFDYKYKFNNVVNDYLTNYICNQLGIDKYNGEEVTSKYIGISGGFSKDNELSIISKNHKKLLVSKIDNEENIDNIIDDLIKTREIPEIKEEKPKKSIKKKLKKLFTKKKKQKEVNTQVEEVTPEQIRQEIKNIKSETPKDEIKEKKKFFFKKKEKEPIIEEETYEETPEEKKKKKRHIFAYILLFLFAVYLGLLVYCILYIYGVGSINDGIDENIVQPKALKDKGNFTEIMGRDIFNQTEGEYFVLLYTSAKREKTKYYVYINEYTKRNIRFYFVDLKNSENKFLYGPNELDFTLAGDRLLKVKDKEYEYYVDGKMNILNEMQSQIEEIMQKEKENENQAINHKTGEEIKNIILSMTDNKKDDKPITESLLRAAKKEKNLNKYTLNINNKIDFDLSKTKIKKEKGYKLVLAADIKREEELKNERTQKIKDTVISMLDNVSDIPLTTSFIKKIKKQGNLNKYSLNNAGEIAFNIKDVKIKEEPIVLKKVVAINKKKKTKDPKDILKERVQSLLLTMNTSSKKVYHLETTNNLKLVNNN